jgi:hypothetical protein
VRLDASFRETMSGSFWLLAAPTEERALSVSFEARPTDVRDVVSAGRFAIAGTIEAEGLAPGHAVEGSVAFHLLRERRVAYRFFFGASDGRRYELSGQKEWSGVAPVASLTLLPATIYDDRGQEVARATLRFDWRADLGRWLGSWKLRLAF